MARAYRPDIHAQHGQIGNVGKSRSLKQSPEAIVSIGIQKPNSVGETGLC